MMWREKRLLLIVLGLLLAANTIFFFTYRVRYEQRLAALEERREESEKRLVDARAARMAAEHRVAAYRKIQRDIEAVYNEHWSTQGERLTALIIEVKRLALASQLIPQTYSFSRTEEKLRGAGATPAATVVAISFTVQGTYQQARRLINLLELSRQFVIIDQISLSSGNDQRLTLNLRLKTLFRNSGQPSADAGQPL